MSDHADLLRRAAKLIRETAQAATEGPWKAHDTSLDYGGHTATVLTKREALTDTGLIGWLPTFSRQPWNDNTNAWADALHVALWHPVVALAVAGWLESTADLHEETHPDVRRVMGHGCQWCADEDWPCADMRHAEAVARAVLGKEPAE